MIDQPAFAKRISALGPFEPRPHLAVAVSGGSDSLALALLAQGWVKGLDGRITALTVDHALRPGSRAEALQLGRWLKKHGIAHRILTWEGDKPESGRMAAARQARYRLLEGWCARAGVLHLLLAHQLEDQAETFLMRLARGSGADGLAAMQPVLHSRHVRLLRPLLEVTRQDLRLFLKARGQGWIDDPSNDNPAFERVRMRQAAPGLAGLGLTAQALAASAAKLSRLRSHLEAEAVGALARHVTLNAAGFAWIAPAWQDEAKEVQRRVLSRLLACLNGESYVPAEDQVETLRSAMAEGNWRGGTLAGCRLVPRQKRILAVREAAACGLPVRLSAGLQGVWDGRFRFVCRQGRGLVLGGLGSRDAAELARLEPSLKETGGLPSLAWPSLPALRDARGVFAVPGLGYKRSSRSLDPLSELTFAPRRALTGLNLLLS